MNTATILLLSLSTITLLNAASTQHISPEEIATFKAIDHMHTLVTQLAQKHSITLDKTGFLDTARPRTEQGLFLVSVCKGYYRLITPWGLVTLCRSDHKKATEKSIDNFTHDLFAHLTMKETPTMFWHARYKVSAVDGIPLPKPSEVDSELWEHLKPAAGDWNTMLHLYGSPSTQLLPVHIIDWK